MFDSRNSSGPREVFIETTQACNLSCVHCAVSQPGYCGSTLSWEAFSHILPFLHTHHPLVHLNGHGETLLCKRFLAMFEAVVGAGCRVGFQTNATLLQPELTQRLLDVAGPQSFSYICLSIDAAEGDLYERIRREASFETFCTNARVLAEERRRRELTLPKLKFEFVAMRMNVHQLPDTVRLVAQLGGDELDVSDLVEYSGMEGQKLGRDLEFARPFFREAANLAKELRIGFRVMPVFDQLVMCLAPARNDTPAVTAAADLAKQVPFPPAVSVIPPSVPDREPTRPRRGRMVKNCRDPWDLTMVQASGEVVPCCMLTLPMGNVSEQPLEEIWRGPQYTALRRLLASPTPLPDCTTCIMRGWKPASVRTRVQEASRWITGRVRGPAHLARLRRRPSLEVRIVPNREVYRPGESCRAALSVAANDYGSRELVDVYVAVILPWGDRLWATDRGLRPALLPFLAAWEPFSFDRLDVFEHAVPTLSGESRITLLVLAVPTGVCPQDETGWITSHSSRLEVVS
jgi:MoaA/NifB/PqqE/SkfB family radical SAM enzyme